MEYWPLKPGTQDTPIEASQVAALLARVGSLPQEALAGVLLHWLTEHVALAQCAVFSYPPGQAPRIVSYADRARTRRLPAIAQDYVTRFHREDGSRQAMASVQAERAGPHDGAILLHRQTPADLGDGDYRAICYDQPRISERIALLSCQDRWHWLSINLYRGHEHGPFLPQEVACIEAFAPFLTQLVRLHLRCHQYDNELGSTLVQRLKWRFPALTRRDLDLLDGVVAGQDGDEIAHLMGIQPASVQTYLKRLYRKLGISGQRELFGLMLAPLTPDHWVASRSRGSGGD
jgi:DNA-binding CsgD family transcriptional regulator